MFERQIFLCCGNWAVRFDDGHLWAGRDRGERRVISRARDTRSREGHVQLINSLYARVFEKKCPLAFFPCRSLLTSTWIAVCCLLKRVFMVEEFGKSIWIPPTPVRRSWWQTSNAAAKELHEKPCNFCRCWYNAGAGVCLFSMSSSR